MSDSAARPVTAVLPGLLLAMFLGAIDLTIMAPALPAIAQDLGGFNRIPVVVTGYLLAATVMMPIYGKLGDRFGRKRSCWPRLVCSSRARRSAYSLHR